MRSSNGRNDALAVFHQRRQQVQRQQFRIAVLGSNVVGFLNRFLRLYRQFVPADRHWKTSNFQFQLS